MHINGALEDLLVVGGWQPVLTRQRFRVGAGAFLIIITTNSANNYTTTIRSAISEWRTRGSLGSKRLATLSVPPVIPHRRGRFSHHYNN